MATKQPALVVGPDGQTLLSGQPLGGHRPAPRDGTKRQGVMQWNTSVDSVG
jgi:hypothetical protein